MGCVFYLIPVCARFWLQTEWVYPFLVITLFSLEKILREKKELVLLAGFELTSSGSKSNSYVHFSINIELKKNVGLLARIFSRVDITIYWKIWCCIRSSSIVPTFSLGLEKQLESRLRSYCALETRQEGNFLRWRRICSPGTSSARWARAHKVKHSRPHSARQAAGTPTDPPLYHWCDMGPLTFVGR